MDCEQVVTGGQSFELRDLISDESLHRKYNVIVKSNEIKIRSKAAEKHLVMV